MNKQNQLPKISVLLSVHNQLHCLEKALVSAISQNYPNLEIIIGDDCSSDGDVQAFVRKFADHRVRYFRNTVNLGPNGNYQNMLVNCATGDYAIVLNADDYWIDNHFLSEAMMIFQKNMKVSLVFGAIKTYITSLDKFIEDEMHKHLPEIMSGDEYFINYVKGYSLPHLTCLYPRQKAIDLDFYNSDVVSTDWEYLLKIILGSDIGIIHNLVGVLTKHNQNYTKETKLKDLQQADIYIHNVYNFASSNTDIKPISLVHWQDKMLRRHHSKWLVKLWFLDPSKVPSYKKFLKNKYPKIFKSIMNDPRYLGFLLLRKSPSLLRFIFRNIFKQESFIADLIAYKSTTKKVSL